MTAEELVVMITDNDSKSACAAAAELAELSSQSAETYQFMDYFFSLLEDKNSLVRNRVLMLISANAKWDSENIINAKIEQYLSHIFDEKPITARQCIKFLPKITDAKPELSDKIIAALENSDFSGYADSMKPLLEKDAAFALKSIRGNTPEA